VTVIYLFTELPRRVILGNPTANCRVLENSEARRAHKRGSGKEGVGSASALLMSPKGRTAARKEPQTLPSERLRPLFRFQSMRDG
jgi:hypothetical protein